MKYIFLAVSLFVGGSVSAQTDFAKMTKTQMDSAISAGRILVSAKLNAMKTANSSNSANQFKADAQQYLTLMRNGMMESGRMIDLDPSIDKKAGLARYATIEQNFSDYRTLLKATPLNRAEIVKKAEYFQSLY